MRNSADTIVFAEKVGFSLGDRLYYLKIWHGKNRRGWLSELMQNMVPVDVLRFNEPEISKFIQAMERDPSTFGLLGYASAIEQICRYLDRNQHDKVKANMVSAIAMSETLNDYTRDSFEKHFGFRVLSILES